MQQRSPVKIKPEKLECVLDHKDSPNAEYLSHKPVIALIKSIAERLVFSICTTAEENCCSC